MAEPKTRPLVGRDWASSADNQHPGYKSTALRAPRQAPVKPPQTATEVAGPRFGHSVIGDLDCDLTRNSRRNGEPLGERIIVGGRVLDATGRPIPAALVELWQANAAGRYIHIVDQHEAPLDPNFLGAGRTLTNDQGEYEFVTIRPGAYPWGNHSNAWRPAHIHFSVFGRHHIDRLVTQMYFPGDPLLELDPIFNAVPQELSREDMVARFSLDRTREGFALGYDFDMVLRGSQA